MEEAAPAELDRIQTQRVEVGTPRAEKIVDGWFDRFKPIIKEGEPQADKESLDILEQAPKDLDEADKNVWRRHYQGVQESMVNHGINIVDKNEYAREMASKLTEVEIKGETDSLTGLRNRNGLKRVLDDLQARKARGEEIKAIFLRADANGLKTINDKYGHKAGDDFLKKIGEAFEGIRGSDFAARDGGDEFGIILFDTDLEGAKNFWERFSGLLPEGFSIVAGASELRLDSIEESLHTADQEMYKAKTESKDESEGNQNYGRNILRFPASTQEGIAA